MKSLKGHKLQNLQGKNAIVTGGSKGIGRSVINSAIALAGQPPLMAEAMASAVQAGRQSLLAGRLPSRAEASPSSPTSGRINT